MATKLKIFFITIITITIIAFIISSINYMDRKTATGGCPSFNTTFYPNDRIAEFTVYEDGWKSANGRSIYFIFLQDRDKKNGDYTHAGNSSYYENLMKKNTEMVWCEKGHEEGENLNYYYCPMDGIDLVISKQMISESGSIGKKYSYSLSLIFDKDGNLISKECR